MCGGTVPSAESSTLDIVLDTVKGMTGVAGECQKSSCRRVGPSWRTPAVEISEIKISPELSCGRIEKRELEIGC